MKTAGGVILINDTPSVQLCKISQNKNTSNLYILHICTMELQNKMGFLLKTAVGVTRTYPYGVFFMKHFVSNKVQHVVFLAKTIDN